MFQFYHCNLCVTWNKLASWPAALIGRWLSLQIILSPSSLPFPAPSSLPANLLLLSTPSEFSLMIGIYDGMAQSEDDLKELGLDKSSRRLCRRWRLQRPCHRLLQMPVNDLW